MIAKRLFDFSLSFSGLVLIAPLLACIAILIPLDSAGPVFHRGVRVGKDGVPFRIFKFRTMVADASGRGAGITTRNDERITRVGRVLRRTKLDELPQLINVLKGEMSLVGPRPEDPRYVAHYTAEQHRVLSVVPGITSPASIAFRHEQELLEGTAWETTYLDKVLPRKLQIEIEYLQGRTWLTDLQILFKTVWCLFDAR